MQSKVAALIKRGGHSFSTLLDATIRRAVQVNCSHGSISKITATQWQLSDGRLCVVLIIESLAKHS